MCEDFLPHLLTVTQQGNSQEEIIRSIMLHLVAKVSGDVVQHIAGHVCE